MIQYLQCCPDGDYISVEEDQNSGDGADGLSHSIDVVVSQTTTLDGCTSGRETRKDAARNIHSTDVARSVDT